jgi:hypothetical protein
MTFSPQRILSGASGMAGMLTRAYANAVNVGEPRALRRAGAAAAPPVCDNDAQGVRGFRPARSGWQGGVIAEASSKFSETGNISYPKDLCA